MSKTIWLPFEVHPCTEHGMACGGVPKPRHDLPVFNDLEQIMPWMTAPENYHYHLRDRQPVMLQWMEHTQDEAVMLGFAPTKEELH
jgi:hypothetical protein